MAITINQEPDEYSNVYLPLEYQISSDNTSEDNFKFICDIYINGSLITPRLKRSKHPDYDACVFDVHRIAESFVTHDVSLTATNGFYTNNNSFVAIQCKFGEEYGLSSSGVTEYPDLATSTSMFGFNASINWFDFIDWDSDEYILNSSGSQFLHDYSTFYDGKRGAVVLRNQDQWAYMLHVDRNKVDKLVIITYDEDRNMIDEYQIDNPYVAISSNAEKFLRCAIGYNANNIDQAQITTGTQPIFTDSVKYYEVYTVDTGSAISSERMYFEISDQCSPYTQYELTWLNRLGGFDTNIFDHAHTENITIDKKEYKQQVGTMGATSFVNAKSDRGYQNYFTSSNSELKVRTGWITEGDFSWIRYLKESPQVYLIQNGELIAVNVTDSSYEVKQTVNNNLINMEVTLKYSVGNQRQRY